MALTLAQALVSCLLALTLGLACWLLWYLRNGRLAALQGLRRALQLLAYIPVVGVASDLVQALDWLPPPWLLVMRRGVAYSLMSLAFVQLHVWVRGMSSPRRDATGADSSP